MKILIIKILCLALSIFTNGQTPPVFKNGRETLSSFIKSNLKYPYYSKSHCIQGSILIGFQIDKSGNLFNVKVLKGLGIDLDDEAMRLVHFTQGKWVLDINHDITQRLEIPIQFQLNSEDCRLKSSALIDKAIMDYQVEKLMLETIEQFYIQEQQGSTHTDDERNQIESLKAKIGVNEIYFDELLQEAKRDLKNKDFYAAKQKAFKIRNLGSSIADEFIASQNW